MPPISVRLIRTALLWLVAGAAIGGIALAAPGAAGPGWRHAHAEIMLMGWMVQLVLGVAYWILPKHAGGAERGSVALAAGIHPLLNGGVVLAVLAWLLAWPDATLLAARGLQCAAVIVFVLVGGPRIKAFGVGRARPGQPA